MFYICYENNIFDNIWYKQFIAIDLVIHLSTSLRNFLGHFFSFDIMGYSSRWKGCLSFIESDTKNKSVGSSLWTTVFLAIEDWLVHFTRGWPSQLFGLQSVELCVGTLVAGIKKTNLLVLCPIRDIMIQLSHRAAFINKRMFWNSEKSKESYFVYKISGSSY